MKDKMHIVACLDKGFVMPTGVMICSVCVNNPDIDIDFHLVCDESLSANDKKDLEDVVSKRHGKSITFYNINSQLSCKYPYRVGSLTQATYYRLYLTEILPSSINKVLYFDGDCIIRHSLLPLWNTDISEYAVGVCTDSLESTIDFYNRLRYPYANGYFNAGVMLINLDYWRRYNMHQQFIDYLQNYQDRILYEDQDLMNVIFQDSKLVLPLKYNFQTNFLWRDRFWDYWKYEEQFIEGMNDPAIVHFTTSNKPWFAHSSNPHPYRSTFYKYQNMTKWSGTRLERRSCVQITKNYIGSILRFLRLKAPFLPQYIDVNPID